MKEKYIIGGAFIFAGILFLLSNLDIITISEIWPVFLLIPGLLFFYIFFKDRKNIGLLMPATILTLFGMLFVYCELFGWDALRTFWPIFIMAPGLAFFLMYYLGNKEKGFLISGSILVFISLAFLGLTDSSTYFWPVLLIGIGVYLLLLKK